MSLILKKAKRGRNKMNLLRRLINPGREEVLKAFERLKESSFSSPNQYDLFRLNLFKEVKVGEYQPIDLKKGYLPCTDIFVAPEMQESENQSICVRDLNYLGNSVRKKLGIKTKDYLPAVSCFHREGELIIPLPELTIEEREKGSGWRNYRVFIAPNNESLKYLDLRAWDHGGKFSLFRPTLVYFPKEIKKE